MRRCSDSLNDNTWPPPLRPDDCTSPLAPPPLRPDDCTSPLAPPPLRPDDCTSPLAPPPLRPDDCTSPLAPPPLRPDDCTSPLAPPPLRPDDCTSPLAPPPLRPDDCTSPLAPPPLRPDDRTSPLAPPPLRPDDCTSPLAPPPLRPEDCTSPLAPPPLRPDDCTSPLAPPPLRPDDCTSPLAPPPPPLSSPQTMVHSCPSLHNDRPRARLNGDPNVLRYLNFRVEEVNTTKKIQEDYGSSFVKYVDVQPRLQVGPTCGLLALSLVANLVRPITADHLLQMAMDKGFTNHGEMFSAQNMCSLAQEVIGEHCDVVLHRYDMLSSCPDSVWDLLLNNRIFLVPYDKDKDNSPGIYGGHKAHWCVILGVGVCSGVRFYCTAQGKSLKLSLWNTESLAASNKQLYEILPDLMDANSHVTCSIRDELAGCCISFTFNENVTLPTVSTSCDDSLITQRVLERIVRR